MKATGIVRHLDGLGRLVIPSEIRKRYNLNTDDPIEFYVDDNMIIIQKFMQDDLKKESEEKN